MTKLSKGGNKAHKGLAFGANVGSRRMDPNKMADKGASSIRPDASSTRLVATGLFWLLTARLIIPGFFDYGSHVDPSADPHAVFNAMTWLLFIAAGATMVCSRMDVGLRVLRRINTAFLVLIAYAACSVLWSIDPSATLARLFRVVVVILACTCVCIFGWHERRFQQVVRPVVTFFLLGSLIFGLIAPDLAIEPPDPPRTVHYYWGGLTIGKNALGSLASIGIILWVHGWASREVKPLVAACWGLLALTLLLLSRAATYLLTTALVCGLLLLMLRSSRGMRRYMPYIIGLLVVLTIAYGLAVLDVVPGLDAILTPITALTGKDRSFTNRALIWQITREHISLSPILGSGYGGFWAHVVPGTPAYDFFVPRMFFNPGECHDGYLEIINDLGYVGLALLFVYLFTYLLTALRLLKTNYAQSALYLGLLFDQALSGLSESNWLWIAPEFLIFTLATACLARHELDSKRQPSSNAWVPRGASAVKPGSRAPFPAIMRRPVGKTRRAN